jgi:hypothetical protein
MHEVYWEISKCTLVLWMSFYCIVVTDMFRPVLWPSLGWWEQEYAHIIKICIYHCAVWNLWSDLDTWNTEHIKLMSLNIWCIPLWFWYKWLNILTVKVGFLIFNLYILSVGVRFCIVWSKVTKVSEESVAVFDFTPASLPFYTLKMEVRGFSASLVNWCRIHRYVTSQKTTGFSRLHESLTSQMRKSFA